jgi:RNA polymerase sigma-70 factor (ECF subfamily)
VDGGVSDFTAWYEVEAPAVVRALGLVLGDDALAEEAAAEAFAKAFARWDKVRLMSSPVGWVVQVARNEARGRFRRRRLEARTAGRQISRSDVPAPSDPEDALWEAVRGLPARMRTAVAFRYVADLAEGDIAALMGVTRGTVAATLSHARRQLADALVGQRKEVGR